MLRRAAALWPERLEELSVPFLRTGALMIARSDDDAARLSSVFAEAAIAGAAEVHLDNLVMSLNARTRAGVRLIPIEGADAWEAATFSV